jgi:type IV secretion system protein VirB10
MNKTGLSLPPDPRGAMPDDALAEASRNAFPVVASTTRGRDRAGLVAGGAIALALGALSFAMLSRPPAPPAAAPVEAQRAAPVALPPPPAPVPPPSQPASPPAAIANLPMAPAAPANPIALVFDAAAASPPAREAPAAHGAHGAPAGNGQNPLSENEAFGQRVGSASTETASATRMANPALTVTQGTLIPAILETAIDSDLPGYARALVSSDIRGFDGSRILIPRGSRLIGQYKSGLQSGQTRVYVLWQRLIRPDGASVMLASPAIEFSGRSGLSGKVNSHFFKRYSSAILLSVLSGAGAVAGSGTSVVISSGSAGAASVAAQNDAKAPPTIRVPLGLPIRIFTARDLDFASIEP